MGWEQIGHRVKSDPRLREIILIVLVLILSIVVLSLSIALGVSNAASCPTCDDNGDEVIVTSDPPADDNHTYACTNPECLEMAAWMTQNMDISVDPCHDFFRFACGGYTDRKHLQPEEAEITVTIEMFQENQARLLEVLTNPIFRPDEHSYERKLKDLFAACVDGHQRNEHAGQTLVEIIQDHLGGWYVFDPDFENAWNFMDSLTYLHNQLLVEAFFKYDVIYDSEDYSSFIIQVSAFILEKCYTSLQFTAGRTLTVNLLKIACH